MTKDYKSTPHRHINVVETGGGWRRQTVMMKCGVDEWKIGLDLQMPSYYLVLFTHIVRDDCSNDTVHKPSVAAAAVAFTAAAAATVSQKNHLVTCIHVKINMCACPLWQPTKRNVHCKVLVVCVIVKILRNALRCYRMREWEKTENEWTSEKPNSERKWIFVCYTLLIDTWWTWALLHYGIRFGFGFNSFSLSLVEVSLSCAIYTHTLSVEPSRKYPYTNIVLNWKEKI